MGEGGEAERMRGPSRTLSAWAKGCEEKTEASQGCSELAQEENRNYYD